MNNDHLVPRAQQAEITIAKRSKVLSFMYYEKYTTWQVIKELVGHKSFQTTNDLLRKMEKQKWIKRYKSQDIAARNMSFWGITMAGIYAIYDEEVMPYLRKQGFDTKKVNITQLNHLTHEQLIKCKVINSERDIRLRYINKRTWRVKKPDVLTSLYRDEDEITIAFEVELTIKSIKRYKQIINHYHLNHKFKFDNVIWATKDEKDKRKLKTIFENSNAHSYHYFYTIEELDGKIF